MSTRLNVSRGLRTWAMTVLTAGGKLAIALLRARRSRPTQGTCSTTNTSYLRNEEITRLKIYTVKGLKLSHVFLKTVPHLPKIKGYSIAKYLQLIRIYLLLHSPERLHEYRLNLPSL